jgi:signal transduction histidine kinase
MRLTDFIRSHVEEITRIWEEFAAMLPAAKGMAEPALRDHLPRILDAIADDLEASANTLAQADNNILKPPDKGLEGASDAHARLRLESGFDLKQVIAEYRALRAGILRLWHRQAIAATGAETAELIRFNDAIDQLIAEVLGRYIDRATQYNDRFIAILGHDVRNPLNAISASAFLLRDLGGADERHERATSMILRSCRRIELLANDLLEFARSRLGGSQLPLTKTMIGLGGICRGVMEEVKAANPHAVIELKETGDLTGQWDKERLAQVVSNLLLNAIEHGIGTRAYMVAAGSDDAVVLEVRNQGNPIPSEILPLIFDPLAQQRTTKDARSHLGLGLFIAREIVTAHEGTIEVTSSASEGTTFKVSLPRQANAT